MNERRTNGPRTTDPRTNETTAGSERPRQRRWLGAAAAAAALLVVTPVAAHSGAFAPARGGMGGSAYGAGMHGGAVAGRRDGAFGGMRGDVPAPLAPLAPMSLQRLPLGTEVTVEVYDADPAEGAMPVATLSATVGETSEVAFADEVRAATADAAFVSVATGPRTVRVVLDGDADPSRSPLAGPMRFGALQRGQTIEVAFYEGADDAVPSSTTTFTYGEDSAAAFHERVAQAAAEAEVAEVTLPAQARTVDLSAASRYGDRGAIRRPGPGTGRGYGPGARGHVQPGNGFGPWGTPSAPSTD